MCLFYFFRFTVAGECRDVECGDVFYPSRQNGDIWERSDLTETVEGVKVLTTVSGSYDRSKIGPHIKGSWDTIEFVSSDDSVSLEITLQFDKTTQSCIFLRGCRNIAIGDCDGDKTRCLHLGRDMLRGPKGDFHIQISEDKNTYKISIFSLSPGSSQFHTTFNYGSNSS